MLREWRGVFTWFKDKLVEHKQYIAVHVQDLSEIRNWKWGAINSGKPA